MNLYHLVQEQTSEWLNYKFDDKLYTIRRNLMIVSSIVIASAFINPPQSGVFEVNIGLVKGVLQNPLYLYYFLAITCLYYLAWFYIHCRYVATQNYRDIKHRFFYYLAAHRAKEAYARAYNYSEKNLPPPPEFKPTGGGGPTSKWGSTINFVERVKKEYTGGLETLKENGFTISEYRGELIVNYSYSPTLEDFQYLKIHLDMFWRAKWSQIFTPVMPMAYAVLALILLSFNIYGMVKS